MHKKATQGELSFKRFCSENNIPCQRIEEGELKTPDYRIEVASKAIYVEVKDIEEDENFSAPVHTRTIGAHVRAKIEESRLQLQPPSKSGAPTVLLIFNALDPFQAFGTEQHDFLAGMYGINCSNRSSNPKNGGILSRQEQILRLY